MAWWSLINDELPAFEAEKTKTALLEYCELETWAMVKIFEKVYEESFCPCKLFKHLHM